ncbi:hypothetical protein [Trueperella pyogenes]
MSAVARAHHGLAARVTMFQHNFQPICFGELSTPSEATSGSTCAVWLGAD